MREQLKCLGANLKKKEGEFKKPVMLSVEMEEDWDIEDMKKEKSENEIFEKIKKIINKLKETYAIFRVNVKEKKLVEEEKKE